MPETALPEELRVSVTADAGPVSGAWIEMRLPMSHKNDFNLLFGPADEHGRLVLNPSKIEAAARLIGDLFPMDYVGLAAGWSGELMLSAVDRASISRLRRASELWTGQGLYPDDFSDQMDQLAERLGESHPSLQWTAEGGTARISSTD